MTKKPKKPSDTELAAYNHGHCFQTIHGTEKTRQHAAFFYGKKKNLQTWFLSGAAVAQK